MGREFNCSLPFSFSKNLMSNKSTKNVGKTIGIVLLGLAIIGALVGTGFAISKLVKNSNVTQLASNQTASSESSSSSSTSQSSNSSSNSNNNSNNQSEESSSSSSSNSEHQTTATPTINCSAGEVYWFNNVDDSSSWNTLSVVCALNGLPADATASEKGLYIYCDDDDLDQWIEISVVREGTKVVLNSPYAFQSGETITLKQIKAAPLTGFYKIPLWIFATNYDPDQVYHIIDVWFRTN